MQSLLPPPPGSIQTKVVVMAVVPIWLTVVVRAMVVDVLGVDRESMLSTLMMIVSVPVRTCPDGATPARVYALYELPLNYTKRMKC
jgi:hypothetical protein